MSRVILNEVKNLTQGQRIMLQETLRDSSLTLRMTRYNEGFVASNLRRTSFSAFHLPVFANEGKRIGLQSTNGGHCVQFSMSVHE